MPETTQPVGAALLTKVQHSVKRALVATEAREAALADMLAEPSDHRVRDDIGACQKRIGGLEALAVSIAGKLTGVDMLVAKEEDYLRAHLAAAQDLRRRLEEWAGSAIG